MNQSNIDQQQDVLDAHRPHSLTAENTSKQIHGGQKNASELSHDSQTIVSPISYGKDVNAISKFYARTHQSNFVFVLCFTSR